MSLDLSKPIDGYEDRYSVTPDGKVWSILKRKFLSCKPRFDGYIPVSLHDGNGFKMKLTHVLVADAFLPPRPSSKHEVNHKDGNKSNNAVGNLEWMTRAENLNHAFGMGLSRSGEDHHAVKLTDAQISEIKSLGKSIPQSKIARQFNVGQSHISRILNNKIRKYHASI
jgi:hypothetical protein